MRQPSAGLVADRVTLAVGSSGHALVGLLADLPEPASGRPVPGLQWDLGTTAAHTVTVVRRALGDTRRSESPEATAALNALVLTELTERRPAALATLLAHDLHAVTTEVLPRLALRPGPTPVPFHGGTTVPALHAFGALVMELVVHSHDIARALDVDAPRDAVAEGVAADALLALAPSWLGGGAHQVPPEVIEMADGRELEVLLALTGRDDTTEPALGALRSRMRDL